MDGGRIKSVRKLKKATRSKRSATAVSSKGKLRARKASAILPGVHPRQGSEGAAPTADPEELTKAITRAAEVFGDEEAAFR